MSRCTCHDATRPCRRGCSMLPVSPSGAQATDESASGMRGRRRSARGEPRRSGAAPGWLVGARSQHFTLEARQARRVAASAGPSLCAVIEPTVLLHDPLDQRESDSEPAIGAVERAISCVNSSNTRGQMGQDADAPCRARELRHRRPRAPRRSRCRHRRRVLRGVGEEVPTTCKSRVGSPCTASESRQQHHARARVAARFIQWVNGLLINRSTTPPKVDRLLLRRHPSDGHAGDVEQIVDETRQVGELAVDHVLGPVHERLVKLPVCNTPRALRIGAKAGSEARRQHGRETRSTRVPCLERLELFPLGHVPGQLAEAARRCGRRGAITTLAQSACRRLRSRQPSSLEAAFAARDFSARCSGQPLRSAPGG